MKYSALTQAIQGETVDAWDIHFRAMEALEQNQDVIVLSIGDSDFETPQAVVDATIAGLHVGDTHYVEIEGRDMLREKIAADHVARSGQAITKDNVIVLAGAQNALFSTCLCLLEAGDEAIVLQPMYVTYDACVRQTGATLVPVSMDVSHDFRLDATVLESAITPKTKAILFATPSNPSGVVLNHEELSVIADLAKRHDLWVVSDEVYSHTVFEGEHLSIASLPNMSERTVTINSLSKSHAMTGWRVGWAIGPQALINHLSNLSLCMLYGLPGFIQQGAYAALTAPSALAAVASQRLAYQRRRDILLRCFEQQPLLSAVRPQASMFLLVDVSKTGLSDLQFAELLFQNTGVAVLPASAFGQCTANFVRISYVVSEAQLKDACERIRQFMAQLSSLC